MTFGQVRLFLTLHFLGTLALVILLSLITGCIKPPDDTSNEPKTPTTLGEIANTFTSLSPSPDTLKAGDFVWTGLFARIFTNPFDIQAQYTYEVKNTEFETGTYQGTQFNINNYHIKRGEYDASGARLIQMTEGDCELWRGPIPTIFPNTGWNGICVLGSYGLAPFQDQFFVLRDQPYPVLETIKFYNLKVSPRTMSLPAKMVGLKKCYNYKDCKVNGNTIEFEMEDLTMEPPSNFRRMSVFVSNELPYMVSNLETCTKYQIKVQQSTINVETCNRVLDFDLGKSELNE